MRVRKYLWTAALALTLLTATALAAEGDAAQVGDGVYTTLEAAITAAGDGGTVELLKNVTEDVVIPEGADIILDLGQYTLVNESDHTIVNEGTLTIVGNGTEDNVSHGKSAIYNYGTMTIESGTYTRSKEEQCTSSNNYVTTNTSYTVVNIGTLTITGGTFITNDGTSENLGNNASLIRNGIAGEGTGSLTITGGTFRSGANVIKNESGSVIESISGGTFTMDNSKITWSGGNAMLQSYGTVKSITGGTFTALGTGISVSKEGYYRFGILATGNGRIENIGGNVSVSMEGTQNCLLYGVSSGSITITGGTYTLVESESESNYFLRAGADGAASITGGTFSSSVAAYVAEDLCFELDNGNAFTYYTDLDEALSHARPGAVISDLTGEDGEDRTYFTVVFDTDGGSPVGPQAVLSGSTAAEPDAPSRAGCRFTSWYLDGQEYDVSAPVTGSITITAGWQEISGSLTVTAPDDWVNPYSDVAAGTWYYDAVSYVSANGLMGGVGGSSFDPSGSMNRSMVWTVIARLAGETITGSTWAADARAWAVSQGISDGASPDGSVTREELVTMLYRYTGSPEISVSEQGLIGNYPDGVDVSAWAQNAFAWALSQGVIDGRDGKLAAGESITRAEAATILARFHLLSRS